MKKGISQNINKFIIFGIIFTMICGTLLHFAYDFFGKNPVVGIFSPINESVWEHLKLLYYPVSLWVFFHYFKYGKKYKNYFFSALIGLISGLLTIPILFYLYTSIAKTDILAVDIIIFLISIIICFSIFGYLLQNYNVNFLSSKAAIILWEIIFILFVLFTIFPPDIFLFKDHQ